MKASICLIAGIVSFAAVPASADLQVGDRAPGLSAGKWFNLPKGVKQLQRKHLQGQVVVVEFWATWCPPCRDSIPHLIEMHEEFKDRGVILVALSYEDSSKVANYVKGNDLPYVVGSRAGSTRTAYGVTAYPTMFIIDPDGKVAWKGHPAAADRALEKVLKKSPPRSAGILAARSASDLLKAADKLFRNDKYPEAMKSYERISKAFKRTKSGKKARSKIKLMKSNSRIMAAIQKEHAEREAEGWLTVARAAMQYGDPEDAAKYYRRIIKKHKNVKQASLAREELALLDLDEDDEDEDEEDDEDEEEEEDDG